MTGPAPKVVIDTNVLVSALLKDNSPPAFILALIREGMITACLSKDILEEYREVFKRDKFHIVKNEASQLITLLRKKALLVEPKARITVITDDPDDNMFLECAVEAGADFLITGNKKHFPFRSYQNTLIVSPKEFIEGAAEFFVNR
jgi:putative PIN family toxin of toxin-antitoxin system